MSAALLQGVQGKTSPAHLRSETLHLRYYEGSDS